jgi:hypothetical protein
MPTTPIATRLWLKAPGGRIWHLTADERLQEMAMRWNSVVRNRERWDGDGSGAELMRRALADLSTIGIDEGVLRVLVESGLGEIGVGWQNEELGWEARVMPWEFVIVLATREMRRGRLLTIWRHLDVSGATMPAQPSAPQRFLFVDSAPGPLKPLVSFQSDRQVLGAALGIDSQVLFDPDADGLAREVRTQSPEVIHLGAVDAIEAATLMGQPIDRRRHGLCLAGQSGDLATIAYWRVAEALRTNPVPRLVTFSAQRSSRMAALAIGIGYAEAAVGFQDEIDREGARIFYAEFYRQWNRHRWMPHTALVQTRVHLRSRAVALGGAGLVLWSNHSLIDRDPALISGESAAIAAAQVGNTQRAPVVALANPATAIVEVECEPLPRLNYSLLHNDRDLFKRFVLVSPGDEAVSGVCVRVLLSAGGQDVAWKAQLTLTDVITDLRPKVRVPVVSALGRLKESMRSTVLVEVELAGRLIHQSTHPVQLLAGDEWTDDDQDRQWLPSFVLPRDPAITRIVDQAQRALCTLADDPDAAFDGYQGLGIRAGDDPAEAVDLQAQALWAALTWDIGLAYVNPPPTYTAAAQRVRCPSAVLDERRGTCIDLALLLASSWERIGLRPVIILLKGHALPGYWRSESAWDAFRRGDHVTVPDGPVTAATAAWMVEQHAEVVGYVRTQALWPVEATRIAKRSGFADAVHAGMDALRLAADFDCLIDISVAREKGVLPLP